MSLEETTPSEKPGGETDGELLRCEATQLRNGGGVRRHGAAPRGAGVVVVVVGGYLATGPAAAAPALRPGRQRGAARRRGAQETPCENLPLADRFFQKEKSFPCLLQQDLVKREEQE